MADKPLPGDGVFGWFGRQVGYVKKAVKTDPARLKKSVPSPANKPASKPSAPSDQAPAATTDAGSTKPKIIYRDNKIEEVPHPTEPGLKLRRTIIDEVIEDSTKRDDASR